MHAAALEPNGGWRWAAAIGAAALFSLIGHVIVAAGLSTLEIPERQEPTWVEVAVDINEPPPPPPPPDPVVEEPKPDPPKAIEEPVEFEQTADDAQPDSDAPPPPDDAPKQVRRIRRLSDASTVKGGTNLGVHSGGQGSIDVGGDTPDQVAPDEEVVDYVAVATPPKIRTKPKLVIPQPVIDAELEGSVEVTLTIGVDGKVSAVDIVKSLGPDADQACRENAMQTRWKPSMKGDEPVPVKGVPYTCTFKKALD